MYRHFQTAVIFMVCTLASAQFLEKQKDLKSFEGYFNFHYSEEKGEIYLEVEEAGDEFLYVHSLRTGLGSNDIGLDRGQLGGEAVVKFVKAGNKLLLIQQNTEYRSTSENELERRSVNEAFAKSVLFGFEIKEKKGNAYVIDFTPFLMQDTHGVASRLKSAKEGTYKLDKSRSAVWMERTKAFPENSEFETMLTFTGNPEGSKLPSVAPESKSISVIQHHGFVKLPEAGYKPREFEPRCGSYPMIYYDYSSPISEPLTKRLITRHRLEKKNPEAAVSEAKEPIIYYLDPGTPEPVRSALLEGAAWWNQAFEAIGYKDAFQVKLLPADADPMDVRYNVIQWVHRSTRGWSYGATITDPRTGEIIKGHVSLGSLRIRQDYMIAQALTDQPYAKWKIAQKDPMLEMALARIRQLSAHEVGHTLGFAHNFAASTNYRASVMDYPHPLFSVKDGKVDMTLAYDNKIGAWDKVTVEYAYSDIPSGREKEYLTSIIDGAYSKGMQFITDSDARARGGAHSKAHLWDNGIWAFGELKNILDVRRTAMNNFYLDNIRKGQPYTVLEDVFVPLYFLHRYQTEAAVKMIGGMNYDYQVKGAIGTVQNPVARAVQESTLDRVLRTVHYSELKIPKKLLELFPPRAFGYSRDRESFKSKTGVSFDPLSAAATASEATIALLLHPERLNRLIQQQALDDDQLGAGDVIDALVSATFEQRSKDAYEQGIIESVQYVTLQQLLGVLNNKFVSPKVKSIVRDRLAKLSLDWKNGTLYQKELARTYKAYEDDPDEFKFQPAPKIPDGSPIGSDCLYYNFNKE